MKADNFPTLDLDSELGAFVRRENKRLLFARLFGAASGSERLGRYRLLRVIGQGGMGVVYAAHDETLDRDVAIKLVRTRDDGHARLRSEGQAMAKLAHPNVVRVYEVGEANVDGEAASTIAFIAMELIEGMTLGEWLQQPRSRADILAAFLEAGRGLAAAHAAGLIHRDFKPQNVLVAHDGRVMVTDFGLARAHAGSSIDLAHTQTGMESSTTSVAGTPVYMAPEALSGRKPQHASDQFSFCVALWEAIYGQRPFHGHSVHELLDTLHAGPPQPPAAAKKLPRRLHEPLSRGLAVSPDARWPSMDALLDALEAGMLAHRRWLRLAVGVALSTLAAAVLVLVLVVQQRDAVLLDRDEDLAAANAALAQELELNRAQKLEVEDALSRQRGLRAQALIAEDREGEALLLAIQAVGAHANEPPPEARAALEAVLADDARVLEPARVLMDGPTQIRSVAVSRDGTRVAAGDQAGRVRVWATASGELLATFSGHPARTSGLDFSPDGRRVVSSGADDVVRVWDIDAGVVALELDGHRDIVESVRFSPRGDRLTSASLDATARMWDADTGALVAVLDGHRHIVNGVVYAPDGERLATHSYDYTAKIWDAHDGRLLADLVGHEEVVRAVAFSPDGEHLATIAHDGATRLWRVEDGALERVLDRRPALGFTLAFSTDGNRLVTGGADDIVRVWALDRLRPLTELRVGQGGTGFVDFLPAGDGLVSINGKQPMRFWDLDDGRLVARSNLDIHDFQAVRFPADARVLVGGDNGLAIWDPDVDQPLVRVAGHHAEVRRTQFSPDGAVLATGDAAGKLALWRAGTGEQWAALDGHDEAIACMSFSATGALLATGGLEGLVKLWDPGAGRQLATLDGHTSYVLALALTPAGDRLASAELDGGLRVWSTESRSLLAELGDSIANALRLEFSPDAGRLLSTDRGGRLRLWSTDAFARVCTLDDGRRVSVGPSGIAPDGRSFAYTSDDNAVVLRSLDDCAQLGRLAGHRAPISAIAFAGARLVTLSDALRLWDVADQTVLRSIDIEPAIPISFALSADGTQVAFATMDHHLEIWRLDTGERSFALDEASTFIRTVAFAPDGRTLALGYGDGRLHLRDPETGALLMQLGDRVVHHRDDGRVEWPVPTATLMAIGCRRLASFSEYADAQTTCSPYVR